MWRRGHIRIISLLAALLLLPACSAVKLAYNQAPELAYWYLDGYVDFSDAQSLQVKADLAGLHAWHRQTQLPLYVDLLQTLQTQLPLDISPTQACSVFADVRQKAIDVTVQAEPAMTALASTLTPRQLDVLARKFAKDNVEWRSDYLDSTAKAARSKRVGQAVGRFELLYGSPSDAQRELIDKSVDQSRFDAAMSLGERLRRQRDTLQTLALLTASSPADTDAFTKSRAVLRALLDRSVNAPNVLYRDYVGKLTQDGCKTFSDLHNSTTAGQRSKAVATLGGYAKDLKALATRSR